MLSCLLQPFKLASYQTEDTSIRSVAWSQSGAHLSIGLGNGKVNSSTAVSNSYCLKADNECCDILNWTLVSQNLDCMQHLVSKANKICWLQVDLWDISRMQKVRTFLGHRASVSALSWNSHLLSTGGADRVILHRDMRVPEFSVARLQGHRGQIAGLKVTA